MTRFELLQLLVGQARSNGFQYRRWYAGWLGLPWEGPQQATKTLAEERRYYALLFSQDFAKNFWKPGKQMTLQVPAQSFQRRMADGTIRTVNRKSFTRRMTRGDAWRYHLRQMAAAEDPLRYIRRFLRIQENLDQENLDKEKKAPPPTVPDLRFITDEEDLLADEDL